MSYWDLASDANLLFHRDLDGSVSGATTVGDPAWDTSPFPFYSQAALFDGNDCYHFATVNLPRVFTLACWQKATATGNVLFSLPTDNDLAVVAGSRYRISGAGSSYQLFSQTPTTAAHLVGVVDPVTDQQIRLYKNGSLAGTTSSVTGDTSNATATPVIGALNTSAFGGHDGHIADVFCFGRVLTVSEIGELYAGPEPENTVAPTVSGTTTVGSTLTCDPGTWNGFNNGTVTYAYQWRADGVDISGATSATFDSTGRSVGEDITCRVAGSNDGGNHAAYDTVSSNSITLTSATTVSVDHENILLYTEDYTDTLTRDLSTVFSDATGYAIVSNSNSDDVTASINAGVLSCSFGANANARAVLKISATDGSNTVYSWCQVVLLADKSKPLAANVDANGWTILTPSSDSRIIYVDATNGNDGTAVNYTYGTGEDAVVGSDPRNPAGTPAAYATADEGSKQLRDGYPDWLLFKCGETWTDDVPQSWRFSGSGRSETEPHVVASYGTGARPKFSHATTAFQALTNSSNHVRIVGLHSHSCVGDPTHPSYDVDHSGSKAFLLLGDNGGGYDFHEDWLFEDCYFEHAIDSINYLQNDVGGVSIRRCHFYGAKPNGTGHVSNIYSSGAADVLIEECTFDHGGWWSDRDDVKTGATIFNHNLYIDTSTRAMALHNCVVARGSSHGIQQRCGGVITNCTFLDNPLPVMVGNGTDYLPGGVESVTSHNVVIGVTDINSSEPRGWAYQLGNTLESVFSNNIATQQRNPSDTNVRFMRLYDGVEPGGPVDRPSVGITITGNICYDWHEGFPLIESGQDVTVDAETGNYYWDADGDYPSTFPPAGNFDSETTSWVDATRDIESYQSQLSATATVDAFLDTCRQQSAQNWDANYTAHTVNEYIRAGFAEVTSATDSIADFGDVSDTLTAGARLSVVVDPAGAQKVGIRVNGGTIMATTNDLPVDEWADVTVVVPADATLSDISLYINGTACTMSAVEGTDATLNLGASEFALGADVAARFQHAKYYNRVLSSAEVAKVCNYTDDANPDADWPMEEGSGTTAYDRGQFRQHMTIPGAWSHVNLAAGDTSCSYANETGYTLDGAVYVPSARRDPIRAANGMALEYRGRAPRHAAVSSDGTTVDFTGGVAAPWITREGLTLATDWTLGATESLADNIAETATHYELRASRATTPRITNYWDSYTVNASKLYDGSLNNSDVDRIEALGLPRPTLMRNYTAFLFWPYEGDPPAYDRTQPVSQAHVATQLISTPPGDTTRIVCFDMEGVDQENTTLYNGNLQAVTQAWLASSNRNPITWYQQSPPGGDWTWNGVTTDFFGAGDHLYRNYVVSDDGQTKHAAHKAFVDTAEYYAPWAVKYCEFISPTFYIRSGSWELNEQMMVQHTEFLRARFPRTKLLPWISLYYEGTDTALTETQASNLGKLCYALRDRVFGWILFSLDEFSSSPVAPLPDAVVDAFVTGLTTGT